MRPFDLTVVTARDEKQCRLFERRLSAMALGAWTHDLLVVADPPGPQPGNGGSTLYALAAALDRLKIHLETADDPAAAFAGRRILLVHCGGLSQRIPQFAALGKAFAPIEPSGRTVLEAVLESLTTLAESAPRGAFVACGDVVYRGSAPARLPVDRPAVWAWPAPLEQAARHGVFEWDPQTGEATAALQKPSVERLRERGFQEKAPLDTGVLFLPAPVLANVLDAFGQPGDGALQKRMLASRERWQGLDLYGQLIPAFVGSEDRAAHPSLNSPLGRGLQVFCPENGEFLHFGTTPELLSILRPEDQAEPVLIGSLVRHDAVVAGEGTVLVHCRIEAPIRVGEGSFLMGLDLRNAGVQIAPHRLLFSLPVNLEDGSPGEVAVALGVGDDPKAGSDATLMDQTLPEWAARRGLSRVDLWSEEIPDPSRTLWNARLFPVGTQSDAAERFAWLQDDGAAFAGMARWPRLSLAEIQERFDEDRWWRLEEVLRRGDRHNRNDPSMA